MEDGIGLDEVSTSSEAFLLLERILRVQYVMIPEHWRMIAAQQVLDQTLCTPSI